MFVLNGNSLKPEDYLVAVLLILKPAIVLMEKRFIQFDEDAPDKMCCAVTKCCNIFVFTLVPVLQADKQTFLSLF